MGAIKQATRKRFIPKDPGEASDLDASQVFSRFTERTRNVVMAAQNEAHAAENDEIHPEHLALGLLSEPEVLAVKAIVAQGVPLDTVRQAVTGAPLLCALSLRRVCAGNRPLPGVAQPSGVAGLDC